MSNQVVEERVPTLSCLVVTYALEVKVALPDRQEHLKHLNDTYDVLGHYIDASLRKFKA
jgi:hypothetical protein